MNLEYGQDCFTFISPKGALKVPILISVPHCGTEFPEELRPLFRQDIIDHPPDTDWWVHHLYDFAPAMGISLIAARYSRYVIDLNRDPQNKSLYSDGRVEIGLIPDKTFDLKPLFAKPMPSPMPEAEILERQSKYYDPYHRAINATLSDFRQRYGQALLFDAHSIRRIVPSIQVDPFPDLILGTNLRKSAAPELIDIARTQLQIGAPKFNLTVDHPFRGGYITRYFGRSGLGFDALQLEMSQDLYLSDNDQFDRIKSADLRSLLQILFTHLIDQLGQKK